ncbi:MAG: hypothetical protein EXR11_00835 [Rhodospirillaceae bacterium]|nr:hypothetical protein [Rhodospirillaceae bacterium]
MPGMSLAFSPVVPAWVLAALLMISALLVAYGFWRNARGVALRALSALALLIAIADPRLVREERALLNDIAVIVVDESQSQKIGERAARAEKAVAELTAQIKTQANLEVRTLRLGKDARGDGTRLFGPLSGAIGDIPPSRLAGTIIISDGLVHDIPSPDHFAAKQAPVHLLLTGEPNERDRRVRIERAPDFALVGGKATLRISAEDAGASSTGEAARLPVNIRYNGKIIQQLQFISGQTADIPVSIDAPGANIFEIDVDGAKDLSRMNNRALVSINGIRDRLRVLLISGEPHVGERAWRNLLKSDPNVDLVHFTILRPLTKDDGTPLTELALIAFPIRELFEEQLYEFDLIIFDRYSRRGLVPYQFMSNVATYVRAGGAVMLAVGPEYADSFSLFDSPLRDILPAAPTGQVYAEAYRPTLSDVGKRHPVTANLDGAMRLDGQPSWGRWLRNVQVAPTSGQRVLNGFGGEPLLLLDRVEKGRVALLLSDTMWLWGKGVDGGGPQTDFLRRVAHWLMKEPQLEEEALSAEVRGNDLIVGRRSLNAAERPVTVEGPDGVKTTVTPHEAGQGLALAAMPVVEPGLYRLNDAQSSAVAAVGAPNPLENFDVITTGKMMAPLTEATDGGTYWLSDSGTPALRRTAPGRAAHGSTWLGLKANEQYVVTGVSETTLLPVLLVLLLTVGGAMTAWWREGR